MNTALPLAARIVTGLLAGVFFGFAVGVMPALRRVDSQTFVEAMDQMNVAIVNPVFLLVFLGAPALAVAVPFVERSGLTVAAAALGVATLVVSFAWNIPLNNALAAVPSDGAVDVARAAFETPWVVWNIVRTITGTACFACLLMAGD